MNPIISIAYRYLRSKKSSSAVNIISYVSIAGIALAVTAMVVVMSVFNGFSRFTTANMEAVGSELGVYARSGKVIERADSLARALGAIEGVATATPVIVEKAYAIAGDKQAPVTLTGVEVASPLIEQLNAKSIDGEAGLSEKTYGAYIPAIASLGAANSLMTGAETNAVKIYEPRRVGRINPANPMNAFRVDSVVFAAVVSTGLESFDENSVVVPIETVRRLLDYTDQATSVSIYAAEGANIATLKARIAKAIEGSEPELTVLTPMEREQGALKIINVEKWVTFMMLTFILVIAAFNIVTTMAMIIADKRSNIDIMRSFGTTRREVGKIFATISIMITAGGIAIGLVAGTALSLGQQCFGWIKIAADPGTVVLAAYPVLVKPVDLAIVAAVAAVVAIVAATISSGAARNASRGFLK